MKKLNDLVTTIKSEMNNVSYIKLVFDLLMTFLKDFGFDSIGDYFPQIKNKFTGEFFRTSWYQEHSGVDRESFDYSKIIISESGELVMGELKLGHMLDIGSGNHRFEIRLHDIGDYEVEKAFENEWKSIFKNEKNQIIENIVLRLNQGVYNALIKEDPNLKCIFPSFKDFKERGADYQYIPSNEANKQAEEILEKLRA